MPSKPTKVFVDSDVLLFQAASAGEQVKYCYKDPEGNIIAEFNSAKDGKAWLDESEMMGCDIEFGYQGDLTELVREQYFVDKGFDECKKAWETAIDYMSKDLEQWNKGMKITYLISPATGLRNFRYDLATLHPYKGSRKDSRAPKYLEQLRSWVQSLPDVKSPKVRYEIDDVCLAYSQKNGENGLAVAVDKDVRTGVGCWVYHYGFMEEPEWSDPDTVGYLEYDGKKMSGLGYLFLLHQAVSGDQIDGYKGIPKFGAKKAYDLLSPYNNKPVSYMGEIIELCIEQYRKHFGDEHHYKHHETGEPITAKPYDLFLENLNMAYMVKSNKDSAEQSIMKYLGKDEV